MDSTTDTTNEQTKSKKHKITLPAVHMEVVDPKPSGDQSAPGSEAPASGDQSDTPSPEPKTKKSKSGDQKKRVASTKKHSPQVLRWKGTAKFPAASTITLLKTAEESKKRGAAKERYELYENGMTIEAYAQKFKDTGKGTRALANADVRWDHAAGFIAVNPPKEEPKAE